jgi:hypothetical protein
MTAKRVPFPGALSTSKLPLNCWTLSSMPRNSTPPLWLSAYRKNRARHIVLPGKSRFPVFKANLNFSGLCVLDNVIQAFLSNWVNYFTYRGRYMTYLESPPLCGQRLYQNQTFGWHSIYDFLMTHIQLNCVRKIWSILVYLGRLAVVQYVQKGDIASDACNISRWNRRSKPKKVLLGGKKQANYW